jgi:pimeloyl-ACP methyl ester carboxylesterase
LPRLALLTLLEAMPTNLSTEPWSHCQAVVNGVRLHFVEAGSGPLVVLLHGFPEFWYCWRWQVPALAAADFRVLVPDLRGYNLSDKPPGVGNYRLGALVDDVVALIDHAGGERAAVVGHDWGGAIAWALAMRHPQRVERLAILNAPHPAAFRRELANPAQWLRSWYMLFFQLPWLPEWLLRAGDFALLERTFRHQTRNPLAFTPDDIALYKQALRQPGALTATLNYYRALFRFPREIAGRPAPIRAPTLLIWGERDQYLGIGMSRHLERWVPGIRVERLPGISHWVQTDDPERVNRLLIEHLQGYSHLPPPGDAS